MVPRTRTQTGLAALLRAFLRRRGTLREGLVRAAGRAPKLLGNASTDLVRAFLRRSQTESGGFAGRDGRVDLYYTVFGLQAALALNAKLDDEGVSAYVQSYGGGGGLGLVSLCCLARARALLCDARLPLAEEPESVLAGHIEAFRAADGGFHPTPGSPRGTVSAAFLATAAFEDLRLPLPGADRLAGSIRKLALAEGGWANEADIPLGSTHATVAAAALPGVVTSRAEAEAAARWLQARAHPLGGFAASALAPLPDLLSTATALQALGVMGASLDAVRKPCLDFLDSLWTNTGGFHGHWEDDILDVEYTFYGLLALGRLG